MTKAADLQHEPLDSWPMFADIDVHGLVSVAAHLAPGVDLDRTTVAGAMARLNSESRIAHTLARYGLVLLAQRSLAGYANRSTAALARKAGLWASVPEVSILDADLHEFDLDGEVITGYVALRQSDLPTALEVVSNHVAALFAVPPSMSLPGLATQFAHVTDVASTFRWAAGVVRDGALFFRPWDWMDDKDAGIEIWLRSDLSSSE